MNEESVRKRIHQLLDEIQTEADPGLLNRYRSLFRKEVSFFRRSYMAAYLLLLAEEGFAGRDKSRRGRPEKQNQRPSGERSDRSERTERGERAERNDRGDRSRETRPERERDEGPRYLPEDQSVRLFISIGRNRKVFPREILGFILSRSEAAREDIGAIRILDNYSFVQVRTEAADKIIAALNGQVLRGRTLTVDHARIRPDSPDTADEAASPAETGDTGPVAAPLETACPSFSEGTADTGDDPAGSGGDAEA
jgi:hypothetical protein